MKKFIIKYKDSKENIYNTIIYSDSLELAEKFYGSSVISVKFTQQTLATHPDPHPAAS